MGMNVCTSLEMGHLTSSMSAECGACSSESKWSSMAVRSSPRAPARTSSSL